MSLSGKHTAPARRPAAGGERLRGARGTGRNIKKKLRDAALLAHVLCALLVMASAVFVRTPSAYLAEAPAELRDVYVSEEGVPYLTDLDSYYHARLVDNRLRFGSLGDTRLADGSAWDSLRFYPEGKSAAYEPGIVRAAVLFWRVRSLFGLPGLAAAEFSLPVLLSALTALVAYLAGERLGGKTGGLAAGLLVGCAPLFASRTLYGRFDTDMFTLLMELLLILFLTEALRADSSGRRALFSGAFALTVAAFARCWMPRYSMLFVLLTLAGGALYCLASAVPARKKREKSRGKSGSVRPELRTLLGCAALSALAMLAAAGPSIFGELLRALSFSNAQKTGESVLPNLYVSVSELRRPELLPRNPWDSFAGYLSDQAPSTVNGVGGAVAVLLGLAGLALLGLFCFERFRRGRTALPPGRVCALYFCELLVWLLAALVLTRLGVRFICHLSIPVALGAAFCLGRVRSFARARAEKAAARRAARAAEDAPEDASEELPAPRRGAAGVRLLWGALSLLLLLSAVLPAMAGAMLSAADSRPSVTDASANAMGWIRDKVADKRAVVVSWWDMGYYYEYASGHPCLWDGGSQDPVRAILVSRALTADELSLSRAVWRMLAGSGNGAVDYLSARTDMKTAFDAVAAALPLERDAARASLRALCSLSEEEAAEAEALIHPENTREIYLVLSYTMTRQIGWYEYFANWDFTGTQTPPVSTWYSRMSDGTSVFDSEAGQEYLSGVRSREALWRLFFNAEKSEFFTPAFEWHDGLEHVRVWRVE